MGGWTRLSCVGDGSLGFDMGGSKMSLGVGAWGMDSSLET
jgi:hypothetical protein